MAEAPCPRKMFRGPGPGGREPPVGNRARSKLYLYIYIYICMYIFKKLVI